MPFWSPTNLNGVFHQIAPPFAMYSNLDIVWKIFIVFSIFGIFSKVSKWIVFIGWLLLGDYHSHFGAVTFGLAPVLSLLLFFCFIDDRKISLDHYLFKIQTPAQVSVEPLLLHSLYFLLLYNISGMQKIRMTGGDWISGESFLPIVEHVLNLHIPQYFRWLPGLLILTLELLAPLALFRKYTLVMSLLLLVFHIFNKLIFDIRSDFWAISLLMLVLISMSQNEAQSSLRSVLSRIKNR